MGGFKNESISTDGAPTIEFHFSGALVAAELGGATLSGCALADNKASLRIVDADGKELAKLTVYQHDESRTLTENVMDIGSALLWSHWRWLRSQAGHATHVQALRDIIARADASDRSCDAASLVDELRKIVASIDGATDAG